MSHMFNGRPTQAPLNREEQKAAFEALKHQYFVEPPPMPQFPLQATKEFKLTESEALKTMQQQMQERGMETQVIQKVEEKIQENTTKEVIKQFYCRHNFQRVNTRWNSIPINYKICQKCGLVK